MVVHEPVNDSEEEGRDHQHNLDCRIRRAARPSCLHAGKADVVEVILPVARI